MPFSRFDLAGAAAALMNSGEGDAAVVPFTPSSRDYVAKLRGEFAFRGAIQGAERRAVTVQQLTRVTNFAMNHAGPEAFDALAWVGISGRCFGSGL